MRFIKHALVPSLLQILCVILIQSSPVSSFVWQLFPVDEGGKPALDIQPLDEFPHIAYLTEAIPGIVKHAKWNGASFDLNEVASGYFYGPLDLVIVGDEIPHIMYHDHQGESFDPDLGDQTHAFRPSPFSDFWIRQAVADPGHDGWDNAIATHNDLIYTSSIDPAAFGSTSGVEYWDRDKVESIGSGPVDYEFGTSIAMDSQGNPHIAYYDWAIGTQKSETLKYATKLNGTWTIETADEQRGAGKYPAIRISPEGEPAISYYAEDGTIRYAKRTASGWKTEEVDQIGAVPTGNTGARNMTSLDYDPNGGAAISYATFSEVKIAVKTGNAWSIETVTAEPTPGNVIGGLTSLRVASNGTAHIAYYEFPETLIGQGVGIPTGKVIYARGLASNRPPIISGLSGTETAEGSLLSISFEVSDPEMSDVTLAAQGLPDGATLTGTTLTWTPGHTQSGTYEIIITASDGELETVQTVEVVVSNINAPVMITESIPSATTIIAPAGDSRTFEVIPVDEDGGHADLRLDTEWPVFGRRDRTLDFDPHHLGHTRYHLRHGFRHGDLGHPDLDRRAITQRRL